MAQKTDDATLRMVAEVVVGMADYLGSGFDQHTTGLDFLRATKLDDGFRRQLGEAHRRLRARAATTLPRELLVPLKPVLVKLRQVCADVFNSETGPDEPTRCLKKVREGSQHAARGSPQWWQRLTMPGSGAVTFGDLVGKLELLHLECAKCGRSGRYRVARLMRECGPEATLTEWREKLTADCPRRQAKNAADPCMARFPDLVTAL